MNLSDFDFSEINLDSKYKKYLDINIETVNKYKKLFDKNNITGASTLLYKYF